MKISKCGGYAVWAGVGFAAIAMLNGVTASQIQTVQIAPEVSQVSVAEGDFLKAFAPGSISENLASASPLQLHGTIFSSDATQSRALIAQAGGKPKSYRLEQSISSSAVIKEIGKRHVVVEIDGKLQKMELPKLR